MFQAASPLNILGVSFLSEEPLTRQLLDFLYTQRLVINADIVDKAGPEISCITVSDNTKSGLYHRIAYLATVNGRSYRGYARKRKTKTN